MTYSLTGTTASSTYGRLVQVIHGVPDLYYDGFGNLLDLGASTASIGPKGETGSTGSTGANGSSVTWNGEWDSMMLYFNLDMVSYSGNSYICVSSPTGSTPYTPPNLDITNWDLMTQNITGSTGPTGSIGLTGATGPQGIQGEIGATGPQGIQGEIGATGPQGIQGIQGEIGATGPQGIQGIQGEIGATGSTGPTGSIGLTGATGPQGIQGATGPTGPQGERGFSTGLVYYFNPSIPATGATGYFDMSRDLVVGSGTTKTSSGSGDQLIVEFITKPGDPNVTNIPSGTWNFETYASLNSSGGAPSLFANIYIRNSGGTETLIATNTVLPRFITEGPIITLYLWSIPVISTTILATDRIVIKFYSRNLTGRTMTLYFEDTTIAQVTTSLSPAIQGPTGNTGATGATGATGPQGIQGISGETGATGPQGIQGETGSTGPQGETGPTGPQGEIGATGPQGEVGPTGPQGEVGATGPQGVNGQSTNYYRYLASTASTSGNPGSNYLIWNNLTQTSATQITLSHLNADNIDIDVFLSLIETGNVLIIQDEDNSNNYQKFEVSSTITVFPNSYVEVPSTFVTASGTGIIGFNQDDNIIVAVISKGIVGPMGPTGSTGPTGSIGATGPGNVYGSFGITIDGAGSVITSGNKGYLTLPYACTINGWQVIGTPTGSCVIDVWKSPSGFLPTVANSIAGSEKPTLTNQQINTDLALSTWTVSASQYDVLGFNVDSTSAVTRVNLTIFITKS